MKKIALFFTFIFQKIFGKTKPESEEIQKQEYYPTTSPTPFKEWIKDSGYDSLPEEEQKSLYAYYVAIHNLAETRSTAVFANSDIYHAAIAVAMIIATAKRSVTMMLNNKSQEVLDQPICARALQKAISTGVLINYSFIQKTSFIVKNDNGIIRIEICPLVHSAQIIFLNP